MVEEKVETFRDVEKSKATEVLTNAEKFPINRLNMESKKSHQIRVAIPSLKIQVKFDKSNFLSPFISFEKKKATEKIQFDTYPASSGPFYR